MGKVAIVRASVLASVQDLGRPKYRHLGVARGGASDLHAARVANLLVGNPEDTALLEITFGGLRIRFDDERAVAWCGGDFAVGHPKINLPAGRRVIVRRDEEISFGAARHGCRAWLAIGGGIDLPLALGSRATDLRSRFGGFAGRALRDGDELALGNVTSPIRSSAPVASWSAPAPWSQPATDNTCFLRVIRGSEWEKFTENTQTSFLREIFTITAQADRMGARLEGAALRRQDSVEMLSEAVTPGTVQVANDGQPILLLGDCQTIGGYPKIAHVITVDLPRAAQLRPNDRVRFREVTQTEASALFRVRENDLDRFRIGLRLRDA